MSRVPTTYDEALGRAEAARRQMAEIYGMHRHREVMHRAHVHSTLRKRWWEVWKPVAPPLPFLDFTKTVEMRVMADPAYRAAVSDVQWFLQWAQAYKARRQKTFVVPTPNSETKLLPKMRSHS